MLPSVAARAARATVLVATLVAVAGCTPPPVESTPDPSLTSAPTDAASSEKVTTASALPVTWEPAAVEGYSPSETQPQDGLVHLVNRGTACVLQLTATPWAGPSGDDAEATDAAVAQATSELEAATETARGEGVIRTEAGDMAAREVRLTTTRAGQEMDVRMLMRASSEDGVLVGIVHLCPAGAADDAAWQSFASGSTLSGTTATGF